MPLLKSSVTAPVAVSKTCLRSKELSCFSTLHDAIKPFFKQWYIHAIDVTRIMSVSYAEARQLMSAIRSFYKKTKGESITVEEFCAFTGTGKSMVRMHLVSRGMEKNLVGTLGNQVVHGQSETCKFVSF